MSNGHGAPGHDDIIFTSTDWSFSIRGSQLRQRVDTLADPRRRYELAGRTEQLKSLPIGHPTSSGTEYCPSYERTTQGGMVALRSRAAALSILR